jgi:hypothetical protein
VADGRRGPRARRLSSGAGVRLEGILAGDIVEVDHHGRRFHALVTGSHPGGLALAPLDRRVNYHSCRSREVLAHWVKRGAPRTTNVPLKPAPRQLEIDLSGPDAESASADA